MAEAAGAPPTFKLVLVGDGGTGKVSHLLHLLNWEQRHHRIVDVGSPGIGLTIG
jgi:GTPase SAR1 family protein